MYGVPSTEYLKPWLVADSLCLFVLPRLSRPVGQYPISLQFDPTHHELAHTLWLDLTINANQPRHSPSSSWSWTEDRVEEVSVSIAGKDDIPSHPLHHPPLGEWKGPPELYSCMCVHLFNHAYALGSTSFRGCILLDICIRVYVRFWLCLRSGTTSVYIHLVRASNHYSPPLV
ncbi:hypothetical protein J3459_007529 [Metarhizium acridum]|nr:hypothetical protein J3459_007529 [Metarhizium acridum]